MPWRNEGRQPAVAWRTDQVNPAGTCHYLNAWRDVYATLMRRKAVDRLLTTVPAGSSVVDIGCGDGRWLDWLADRLKTDALVGIDVAKFGSYDWPFRQADMEELPFDDQSFDVALMITSLCQTEAPEKALDEACRVADRLLVLDFMLEPVPDWMKGLPHRQPVPASWLGRQMAQRGFRFVAAAGCGPVDGAVFVRTPRWLWPAAAVVTLALDWVMSGLLSPTRSKYQAALYRRS